MSSQPFISIYDSKDHQSLASFMVKNLKDIYRYRFALRNFVVNTLRTRYRKSVLGFLWSLLNPLFFMIVLAVVFSTVFKQDFKQFSILVFSGMIPWLYISACINGGTQSLINAEGFLKKIYVPKLVFPTMIVAVETVNFFFSIISLYLLALVLGFQVVWTLVFLPLVILITFIFNLGLAMIVSVFTIFFRDLTHIIAVILQALFYMLPIVYSVETFPPEMRGIFYYNPFYYFIVLFRKVIYGTPAMTLADWLIPIGLALFSFIVGMAILKRNDRQIIFRL